MKNLILKELYLLSKQERKAKKISFDSETSIILGVNGVGKSSLIKSIYYTLGADVLFSPEWKSAEVISVITFDFDEKSYSMLRTHNTFALFDINLKLIKLTTGITHGIGPLLADLFGFGLKLKGYTGDSVIPPPAYQYLPYYVDQDKGWQEPWNSFENLRQFPYFKNNLMEYHVGIKPKEYYDITAKINELNAKCERISAEKEGLIGIEKKFNSKNKIINFCINIEEYKNEIELLLIESNKLYEIQNSYKEKLMKLNNEKIFTIQQIRISQGSVDELNKDYKYATDQLQEDNVECPTCGTGFENSFIHRFSIAEDASLCMDLIIKLKEDLLTIEGEISKVENLFLNNKNEMNAIKLLLNQKKGVIEFKDVIKSESQKEISKSFKESIDIYNKDIIDLNYEKNELGKEKNMYDDKKLKNEIKEYYDSMMSKSLMQLNVDAKKSYMGLPNNIKDMGSDKPRALMAYYYSILNAMLKYSTSSFFPVVIDSPNQQDQDSVNLPKLMQFAINEKPKGLQLVLASVDLYHTNYNGHIIKLENENGLLLETEYNHVDKFISELLLETHKEL